VAGQHQQVGVDDRVQVVGASVAAIPGGRAMIFVQSTDEELGTVWVVALEWRGRSWSAAQGFTDLPGDAIAAGPDDVWGFDSGTPSAEHYNGTSWAQVSIPVIVAQASGNAVAGDWVTGTVAGQPARVLFPVPLWGFERLHPASIPVEMLEEMVGNLPNVAAIKAEGGMPAIAGFTEVWNRLRDRVVVTMPLEQQAIPLATILPLQLIATSNTECLGGAVPQMLRLCQDGKYAQAMEIYWRVDPGRRANERIGVAGANSVHRMAWRYQAWLTGLTAVRCVCRLNGWSDHSWPGTAPRRRRQAWGLPICLTRRCQSVMTTPCS
jgi:hypothetical protein